MDIDVRTDEEKQIEAIVAVANTLMDINDTLQELRAEQAESKKHLERIERGLYTIEGNSLAQKVSEIECDIDCVMSDSENAADYALRVESSEFFVTNMN